MVDDNEKEYDDDEGASGEGKGGVGGKIVFRFKDAASLQPRDDVLPPGEIKRLLVVHKEIHKGRVDNQKNARKERAALKEGKKHLATKSMQQVYGQGGGVSKYKKHPITNKAYFSGIDKQLISIPSEFVAETNQELREKLEQRFTHRHTPKFNPKPTPRGG